MSSIKTFTISNMNRLGVLMATGPDVSEAGCQINVITGEHYGKCQRTCGITIGASELQKHPFTPTGSGDGICETCHLGREVHNPALGRRTAGGPNSPSKIGFVGLGSAPLIMGTAAPYGGYEHDNCDCEICT